MSKKTTIGEELFIDALGNAIDQGKIEDKKSYENIELTVLEVLDKMGFSKNNLGTYNLTMIVSSLFYIRELLETHGFFDDVPFDYVDGNEYFDLDNPNCLLYRSITFTSLFSNNELIKTINEAKKEANLETMSNNELVYSLVKDMYINADETFGKTR